MKKRNTLIKIILTVLMSLIIATFAACNPTTQTTEPPVNNPPQSLTEGLLITNSDFKVTSGANMPYRPSNWTGAATSSTAFPNDVISGVVSVDNTKYDENKVRWNNLANPGTKGTPTDDNMLMIYMPTAGTDIEGVDEQALDYEYGPTAYGYTSSTFSVKKGCYYKLTVDVKTLDIGGNAGKAGARIYVSSSAFAEFKSIDTNGEWQTYEIYIEGAKDEDRSLTVNLALGFYSSQETSAYLTTGYAFFDNVSLDKIVSNEGSSAKQQYDAIVDTSTDKVSKVTFTIPNSEFEFGTLAASSASSYPSLWSVSTGAANTDNAAPTSYRYNGIVDTEATAFSNMKSKLGTTVFKKTGENKIVAESSVLNLQNPSIPTGAFGTKVYMLSQLYMTAQYLYSSTPIVVEKGKYYLFSVPVYTTDIFGEGVTITLTGNGKDYSFEGISKSVYTVEDGDTETGTAGTTAGWRIYNFAIKGNTFRDLSFTIQLWLGTGDLTENTEKELTRYTGAADDATTTTKKTTQKTYKSDGSFAKGWAFFDSLRFNEISSAAYDSYTEAVLINNASVNTAVDGELNQEIKLDLDQSNYFTSFDGSFATASEDASIPYDTNTLGTPQGFNAEFDENTNHTKFNGVLIDPTTRAGAVDTNDNAYFTALNIKNPGVPYNVGTTNVLMILNRANQLYSFKSGNFVLKQNISYRISVWVKTADIQATSGAYLYLFDDKDVEILSSGLVNTKDYKDEFTNDYVEYKFIVRGYRDKDTTAYFKLALGSGNRWTSSTLAEGAAFFSNLNCVEITETEYTKLSSVTQYTKAKSLSAAESGKLIPNAAFDLLNLEKTKGMVNGELKNNLGVPQSWTATNEKSEAAYGVARFNTANSQDFYIEANSQLATLGYSGAVDNNGILGGTDWSIYDNWPTDSTNPIDNLNGGPNALIIDGKQDATGYALGYTSNTISLSKVTNYKISVWVRTVGTTTYSIYLTSENGSFTAFGQDNYIEVKNKVENTWTKHTFYVEVGLVSTSVKLSLWLGSNKEVTDEIKSNGLVIFDSISSSTALTSEEFDALTMNANDRKISFLADGFDAAGNDIGAKASLAPPNGWEGTAETGGSATKSAKGVIYVKDLGSFIDIEDVFGTKLPDNYDTMEEGEEKDRIAAQVAASKIPSDKLTPMANGGNRFLIINNKEANGFGYKSTAYTLSSDTFFKISVFAKTYNIEEGKGAYITIDIGENDKEFLNVNTADWTEYVFYIKTADTEVSNVTINIGLGRKATGDDETQGFVTGYAMFDNVTFGLLTETEFETETDETSPLFVSGRAHIIETPQSAKDVGDDDEDNPAPAFKPDLTYLWWMIPSIVIAVALIAVLIAVFVKKVYKPKKQIETEASYSKDAKTSDSLDVKKSEYEKFKE